MLSVRFLDPFLQDIDRHCILKERGGETCTEVPVMVPDWVAERISSVARSQVISLVILAIIIGTNPRTEDVSSCQGTS